MYFALSGTFLIYFFPINFLCNSSFKNWYVFDFVKQIMLKFSTKSNCTLYKLN